MSGVKENKKPEVIVFAGPNGSGKSSVTSFLNPPQFLYINADNIKRTMQYTDLQAAEEAEKMRERAIAERKDFSFETVLSTDRNLKLLIKAKNAGYFVRCYYVLTVDPIINISRIESRVRAGGHDVPSEKIIKRYYRALDLVHELIPVCDVCHIYDNSQDKPYRIFKKRKSECWYYTLENYWRKSDIELLTGIHDMKSGISP